jgi:type I restriction enzyme, R subunit
MKRSMNEAEICQNFITPALEKAGWAKHTQIRREYPITAGRVVVRGKLASRDRPKRADYVLFYQSGLPLAVIEAKDSKHSVGSGMQQAMGYAEQIDVPFVFSSNGDAFMFRDNTGLSSSIEKEIQLNEFPSPEFLWNRYCKWKGFNQEGEKLARQPYHDDGSDKAPRYYQHIAIQRTIEAISKGQNRLLLVMATGTGKTYTVFQLIWRLWKAGNVKRVLYLVDRNILADQTITGDFKPFGNVMTKVKHRNMDPAYEIYLALYQAVTGSEEENNVYKQFTPEFFDLIIIDECHRGSAKDDSSWREILDYFRPAIQLGLTATPKETKDVSTLSYFGTPLYEYSLKQGIDDGFLAPYKVIRIDLDRDLQGWRPSRGMTDDHGYEIEDRIFNQKDMDRKLILNERTKLVAQKVFEYMMGTDPYGKAIVFCADIDHAERMRTALVNEIAEKLPKEATNRKFVMRITGDNDEGKAAIDPFINPEKRYPVIATTSKLLSTGVDAKPCKLIVLDQSIKSMIEFKQTVGRGTRIHEETGKMWFTIMDFRKATELFSDPDFDGAPVIIYEPEPDLSPIPPDMLDGGDDVVDGDIELEMIKALEDDGFAIDDDDKPRKYVVSGVTVSVLSERVMYYGKDGKLITESLKDYTRETVKEKFATLDAFLKRWSEAERKTMVIEELREQGVMFEALKDMVKKDIDSFDLICHVVWDQPPLTRRERANNVKKRDVFTKYSEQARAVLNALLDKYADEGVIPIETPKILKVQPLSDLGTPMELIKHFGDKDGYMNAVHELEDALYA